MIKLKRYLQILIAKKKKKKKKEKKKKRTSKWLIPRRHFSINIAEFETMYCPHASIDIH